MTADLAAATAASLVSAAELDAIVVVSRSINWMNFVSRTLKLNLK